MSDINKRLERAEKNLQKGKLSPALEEFRAVLAEDPGNDYARQRAADLCISLNLSSEAAEHLGEIFDNAAAHSRNPEAIQAYKKLQHLGPVDTDRMFKYAQIVERSSPREAIEILNTVFQNYLEKGEQEQALATVKHMVALDPSPENYHRQAQLCVATGETREAALAYKRLGDLEEAGGKNGAAAFEQAYLLDPDDAANVLTHARCLVRSGDAEKAVEVLKAHKLETSEYLETLGNALLMANQFEEAQPVVIKLYGENPTVALPLMGNLLDAYLRENRALHAVGLARAMETKTKSRGGTREFLMLMQELAERNPGQTDFLEYLAQLYNNSNREHEYCETLLKLFELHYANRNFVKAAECLDRASEVDAYEPGHAERLETLRGKIDANKFNTIANRLTTVTRTSGLNDDEEEAAEEVQPEPEKSQEPTIIEDLMLQAEIFLQYSMRSKAVERLERISKLFPREEEKNEKLAQLFTAAGFVPKYGDEAEVKRSASATDENAVDNFARVTEMTRNIARQSSVKAVLFATVNDVGRHWNVSRCVAGLSAPGKPPSAAMEYCASGIAKSDVMGLARLISTLQAQAVKVDGPVTFEHAQKAPELETIRPVLVAQKIESLIAVPLVDREEHIGIVILEQCGATRNFRSVDQVVLNTIAEQIVLAVNNARLRTLVKTLAVTDEKSGLLRRSSYLDVLLSEVRRSLTQKSPVTLVLMNFGSASALVKESGEAAIEATMQEIAHAITSNIRQNDIAVNYGLTTIALILADTTDKNAFFVLDKLRKAVASVRMPGRTEPVTLTAGIAELVMRQAFDPVDIVTEGINRVEAALDTARAEGGNRAHAMAPIYNSSTVSA
jgi:diguanylate cyclase (GGDEF)-like protein